MPQKADAEKADWSTWGTPIALMCLLVGWNYSEYLYTASSPFFNGDFFVYYLAVQSWLRQMNPYVNSIGLPSHFVYPPTSLLILGMFGMFSFDLAKVLWEITYFSLFVVATFALMFTLNGKRKPLFLLLATLLVLTSYPLLIMYHLGQIDLLVADLTILSLVFQRLKHQIPSALLLSMATLLKGPPVLLLIYFVLFRRDLRYLVNFLISSFAIVGVSLIVIPFRLYSYYVVNVAPEMSFSISASSNQSIMRFVSLAGMTQFTPALALVGVCLFAVLSFKAGSRESSTVEDAIRSDAMFLMNGLIILLFGPRSTGYPYVWTILPSALFLSALLTEKRTRFAYLVLVGFGIFVINAVSEPSGLGVYPLPLVGGLILLLSLLPIYIRPAVVFRSGRSRHR